MDDQPRLVVNEAVLLEYNIAGRVVELYVTSTDAAGEGAYIFQEVVLDDEYLKHGLRLHSGSLVVDIGAHIGTFGIRALTAVQHGDVTYIGIEPWPQTFQALNHNLLGPDGQGSADSFFHLNEAYSGPIHQATSATRASARYPGNIMLYSTAVSDHTGHQTITYYPHMPSNTTFNPAEKKQLQAANMPAHFFEEPQELLVPVTTLDQLLLDAGVTGRNVDLLKIDVEGHEVEVLQGISDKTWECIQQLVVEAHDVVPGGSGRSTPSGPRPSVPCVNTYQQPRLPHKTLQTQDTVRSVAQQLVLPDDSLGAAASDACKWHEKIGPYVEFKGSLNPQDGGRVMLIASMLTAQGFLVVIDCPMGLPTNFTLYARKKDS